MQEICFLMDVKTKLETVNTTMFVENSEAHLDIIHKLSLRTEKLCALFLFTRSVYN